MNKLLASCILASLPALTWGWGQKGHDVTAYIAESHLTPVAQQVVDSLLGGKSIVYWSNWLDNASHTADYAYTKTWHYKNIDADTTFELAPLNPGGDVVKALNEQIDILSSPTSTAAEKTLALKIVVHLMGDLHQPMHIGRASDRGGNNVKVKWFDRDTNLHSAWDSSLPEAAHKWSYTEWGSQLDRLPAEEQLVLIKGGPFEWGKETYGITKDIYARIPSNGKLEYNYIAAWTPVVEQQLLKGGLRLADVLNTAFDPDYKAGNVAP